MVKLDGFPKKVPLKGKSDTVFSGASACAAPVFMLTKIMLPAGETTSFQFCGRHLLCVLFLSLLGSTLYGFECFPSLLFFCFNDPSSGENTSIIREMSSPVMFFSVSVLPKPFSFFSMSPSQLFISSGPHSRKSCCWKGVVGL